MRGTKYNLADISWIDPLAYYLLQLGLFGFKQYRQFGLADLLANLEYQLQRDPRQSKRIYPAAKRDISNIAALSEVTHHLRRLKSSWSRQLVEKSAKGRIVDLPICGFRILRSYKTDHRHLLSKLTIDGQDMLLASFYNKPAPNGPKSMARLNESRSQRQAIEKFWGMMRELLKQCCHDCTYSNEQTRKLLSAVSVHLTPEYAEAVRRDEKSFTLITETEPERSRFVHSEVCNPNNSRCTVEVVTTSNKIKTRGTASQGLESAIENGDTTGSLALKRRPVAKHELEIFRLIFPESAEERCRTVSWDEFVHAMKHAGCVAINCGGSAVRFELQDTSDEATSESKSIIFHRPHPVPKIDPIMLRSEIGRRLTRRFGWTREHFVLAGVDETAEKPVPTADDH